MLKTIKTDLDGIISGLDHLKANLERLTRDERVDVGARINSIAKDATLISDEIKDGIKAYLKHRPGEAKGEVFKAVLQIVEVTRLDSKALKEDDPVTYLKYARLDEDERVSYRPR